MFEKRECAGDTPPDGAPGCPTAFFSPHVPDARRRSAGRGRSGVRPGAAARRLARPTSSGGTEREAGRVPDRHRVPAGSVFFGARCSVLGARCSVLGAQTAKLCLSCEEAFSWGRSDTRPIISSAAAWASGSRNVAPSFVFGGGVGSGRGRRA
eukprot:CAMPEP_0113315588 /NCGR_PEP_ID=MMETSP0010_2-20120614/11198_1 /TAXON_ID=216773 ORGANISM="Corethron hystrix, Strain 308" /NCGR_SAMPLE_ID=MMETSP0010_2 /ASSEMBLY_ACC=CAM_ASM_000155 /LENGTH=152 /DNA_ID=CAMNT_0000172123 /DNA_START=147 /DNA_END=605 /DNA_ORIENTATION=+ /assembly_acc=CAM_ASM_000155